MFEIQGKVNTAICYAKVVEEDAIEQVRRMCDHEFTKGSRIRIMSRTAAKNSLSLDEYQDAMQGIYTTSVNASTLDEAPMAYKSLEDIIDVIRDSVDIIDIMKPVYNFKAAE